MIEMTKKYKFKNAPNYEYELLATDMGGRLTILGRHRHVDSAYWSEIRHSNDGNAHCNSNFNLVEVGPYDHIKKGDRALVWSTPETKYRRYFSHVDANGRPCVFLSGADEWSSKGDTTSWDNCELWENDDVKQ